jgi:hypothetical protein
MFATIGKIEGVFNVNNIARACLSPAPFYTYINKSSFDVGSWQKEAEQAACNVPANCSKELTWCFFVAYHC